MSQNQEGYGHRQVTISEAKREPRNVCKCGQLSGWLNAIMLDLGSPRRSFALPIPPRLFKHASTLVAPRFGLEYIEKFFTSDLLSSSLLFSLLTHHQISCTQLQLRGIFQ